MSVVPSGLAECRHIPTPWVIDNCILGFFILKGGQINLYPEASSPSSPISCYPKKASSGLNVANFTHSIYPKLSPSKRMWASKRFPRNPWDPLLPMPLLDFGSPAVSECSIDQRCCLYHHFILTPPQRLPPSLTSPLWHHSPQLESWGTLPFPIVTLALWPSFSSLPQPQLWCGNLPALFSLKLLSVWVSKPNWMGLLRPNSMFLALW